VNRPAVPLSRHLLRVRDLIDRAYAEQLDIAALARSASVSQAYFSRSFKSAFGETPHQYLMSRRMERAMALLRAGDLSVTDVCFAVGFSSLGSFSTQFRRFVATVPAPIGSETVMPTWRRCRTATCGCGPAREGDWAVFEKPTPGGASYRRRRRLRRHRADFTGGS